nr:MAG TPA: hypothetical protein [Caudoviricetes sp.]
MKKWYDTLNLWIYIYFWKISKKMKALNAFFILIF